MASINLLTDIDISRPVGRLRIVQMMDYALVYASLQLILDNAVSFVADEQDWFTVSVHIGFIAAAGYCFVVGMRNIGSLTSRTWVQYTWILALLVPSCLVMAALLAWDETPDAASRTAMVVWGLGAALSIATLIALTGLRSMRIGGTGCTLQEFAKTMADSGRIASEALDFSKIKRVNLRKGLTLGALGAAVLIASAYGYHLLRAAHTARSVSELHNQSKLFGAFDCLGFFLLIRMRRYFQVDADALLRSDTRAPVLFLRSFEDDEKPDFAQSDEAIFDYSLETRLSRHFMHFGPFVAVGAPNEELPLPGAARIRLSDADWQAQVRRWMARAQVILMYGGNSYWVNWELGMLASKDYLHKVILLFPPRRGWAQRSEKSADDIKLRVALVEGALQNTRWAAASELLQPDKNLRALVFRLDGTLTVIRCGSENRDAYHLAALVGHYRLRDAGGAVAVLCLRALSRDEKRWPLFAGTTRIGAGGNNDIVLAQDSYVSTKHACIECTGPRISVIDLGSTNGTFVNGRVLRNARHALKTGDELRIGRSVFEVRTE